MLIVIGLILIVVGIGSYSFNNGMVLLVGVAMFALGFDLLLVKSSIADVARAFKTANKKPDTPDTTAAAEPVKQLDKQT
jgi:uncharacterized membrane protein